MLNAACLLPDSLPSQALCSMLFLRLHPKPMQYTPSYEFTVSFVGVGFGTVSGTARTVASYEVFNRMGPHLLTQQGVLFILRRMFVGAPYLPPDVCEQAVVRVSLSVSVFECGLPDLSWSSAVLAGEESLLLHLQKPACG